ncbi:MAG: hypothetical protein DWH91_09730 [Planctomycetota bacterium]|nr:MAG: hypothetical protein DWH91_09730 [Planctomycetota bacterium]
MTRKVAGLLTLVLFEMGSHLGAGITNPLTNDPLDQYRNDLPLDCEVAVSETLNWRVRLLNSSNQGIGTDWSFTHNSEEGMTYDHEFQPGGIPPHFPVGDAYLKLQRMEGGSYVDKDFQAIVFFELE